MSNSHEIRWQQRLENFQKALKQLEVACKQDKYSDLERAGLVQMFEFTFKLAWKTLKDILLYEGFEEKIPRGAIRRAFEAEYLTENDTELWLDALGKRNLLSHTYEEKIAKEVHHLIINIYEPMLQRLMVTLENKKTDA